MTFNQQPPNHKSTSLSSIWHCQFTCHVLQSAWFISIMSGLDFFFFVTFCYSPFQEISGFYALWSRNSMILHFCHKGLHKVHSVCCRVCADILSMSQVICTNRFTVWCPKSVGEFPPSGQPHEGPHMPPPLLPTGSGSESTEISGGISRIK